MFELDNLIINGFKDLFSTPYKMFAIIAIIAIFSKTIFPQKKDYK